MDKFKIQIRGVPEPVPVSQDQYAYIKRMIRNRRSDHWFVVGGHTVIVSGEELTLVDLEEE